MKILDRYVLKLFLKNYLISVMVLIGLYIVMDMVFSFDEFVEYSSQVAGEVHEVSAWQVIGRMADFYFYQIFYIFVHLSGIIPVVAAAFTLMRLSRFNELVGMLAAGVPLLRVAAPIIIVSLVLNGLLFVDQEVIIPAMIHKLVRRHDEVDESTAKRYPIRNMQDSRGDLLSASQYYPPAAQQAATIEILDVIQFDQQGVPVSHVSADRAVWDDAGRKWVLTNGMMVSGLSAARQDAQLGDGNGIESLEQRSLTSEPVTVFESSINPEEISLYRNSDFVELLSTRKINELLERPKNYGAADLLRVKHFRFTQIFINVTLLLLAIPCVLTREPGRLKAGAFKTVILTGACLAMVFLTQQLAASPPAGEKWLNLWPSLMAWSPVFLFGPIALAMLERVKT